MGQINELKDFTRGQLDAALMKIGQDAGMGTADGISAFLAGKLVISTPIRDWREQDGVIYLPQLISNGRTGLEWTKCLNCNDYVKSMLLSADFKPTPSGTPVEIAILKGLLFSDSDRVTKNIRKEAYAGTFTQGQKLCAPNAEIMCLIREKYTNEDIKAMGLTWIVTMHEPIKDSDGDPNLLRAYRDDAGCWLRAYYDRPDGRWLRGHGFAFAVSH